MKLTFELEETTISDIQNNLDPFSELFNNFVLKICWVFLAFGILTFSNPYNYLVILYEKYGEDSMKRSLYNQLISQASYPIILHNLVCASHCNLCNRVDCFIWKTFIFQIFNIQPPRLLTNLKNESFPNKTIYPIVHLYIFTVNLTFNFAARGI